MNSSELVATLVADSVVPIKMYGVASHLAGINVILILYYYFLYSSYFTLAGTLGGKYAILPVVLLAASRIFQCLTIDNFIAHFESLRFTRGWDGLSTSLFKSKDNTKEIQISKIKKLSTTSKS